MKRGLFLLFYFYCLSAAAGIADIYVAPAGNDAASGSKDHPVATLGRALEIARDMCGDQTVTIYLREGKYRISDPVIIGPEHSGTKEHPLTITAYPGEKVTLSTSQRLDLDWKPYADNVFVAEVAGGEKLKFDRLFVNGHLQWMARYPNRDPEQLIFDGFSPDAIAPERVARWEDPSGAYLHAMHRSEWGGYQYVIEGKDKNGGLILGAGFQNNRMAGMHPEYRMVENVFEELDDAGEWFFDKTGSKLYYIPCNDTDILNATFESPQSEALITIRGEADRPVEYVNIAGLELCETVRTFLKTAEPLLRSDWKIYRGGAVYFENATNCSLSDCHIHDIGGNAVFLSGYNRNNSIRRNHIEHIGASAVCFVGKPESVRAPLFEYNERQDWNAIDLTPGPCGNDYPAYCDVTDNLIHSIGEIEKQGAGIQISMSMDITVCHNSIYRLPRAGINISEGTWGGHIIEWNDVFDTVRETGDHGSFNSWGRDRYWHPDRSVMDSLVDAHPDAPYIDAVHTTIIRNNRWRCDHGWDIDLDDGSSNYHIYNNLCLNGGLKLREGIGRVVENNIMVNNSFHPHVWFNNSRDVFRHNIVTTSYQPIGIEKWGKEVDHNYFVSEADLSAARTNGTDRTSSAGDPEFINTSAGDYRVSGESGAKSVGFVNFPMDSFGVIHPPLRAIARRPPLPEYPRLSMSIKDIGDDAFEWNGVSFKSVTSEGERSATGIASVKGVLVTGNRNPAIELRANDVILRLNDEDTDNAAILRELLERLDGTPATVERFRDQKASKIKLHSNVHTD